MSIAHNVENRLLACTQSTLCRLTPTWEKFITPYHVLPTVVENMTDAEIEAAVEEIREKHPTGTVVTIERAEDSSPWDAIVTGHGYTEQTPSGLLAESALGPHVMVSNCYEDYRNPIDGMCRAASVKPEHIR
ncbi:hypothetical protein M1M34_gp091 [Haloarcula tailed virus 2]|uniref:Uncharacterized protein n=1 Tax=Haloarcula tailed virus 2 TaxID=2877989 RepID=A0AAE8XZX6_9CAUD|nr:hypothetical protein M1M34_gp091 [Haloarcula tailed virus 2]UBF23242.1 hypothetical protein HATV-2_gp91 [Haloarcula tailed virus 2]